MRYRYMRRGMLLFIFTGWYFSSVGVFAESAGSGLFTSQTTQMAFAPIPLAEYTEELWAGINEDNGDWVKVNQETDFDYGE